MSSPESPRTGPFYEQNKQILLLLFFCTVLLLSNLSVPGMFMDGVIYAVLGKNFALHGGWPVPKFTDFIEPEFFDHPPYFFYFESIFFKIFGISWASARASGVFFSIASVLGLYSGVKKITEDNRKAFLSGIVLLLFLPFLKKSRFPNMDLPLTFFILSSAFLYFRFYQTKKLLPILIAGLTFGLAMLVKGVPALPALAGPGLFILLRKNWQPKHILLTTLAAIIGLSVFTLWPLNLVLAGKYYGFEKWLNQQVVGSVVKGRDTVENNYFFYFTHMFKYCLPWLGLTLFALYRSIKNKMKDFELFCFCMVASYLIPLSFMKWKLSHYILPIYPFMAFISANQLCRFFDKKQLNLFFKIITVLLTILGGIYAFTDVGGKVKRDTQLITILENTDLNEVKNIAIVNHSLPKWSSIGTIEFHLSGVKGHYISSADLSKIVSDKSWLLISNAPLETELFSLLKQNQNLYLYKNY